MTEGEVRILRKFSTPGLEFFKKKGSLELLSFPYRKQATDLIHFKAHSLIVVVVVVVVIVDVKSHP